ncbi:hypothetical protein [Erythrobacter donghaensis]|uniref:hypothetical protein n=1 Tax=Erythrobacter donghaensis TaxID=267135 RepID=UPI000939FBFC|nr:hypothetical protein [Erythrobacter donghaensis]
MPPKKNIASGPIASSKAIEYLAAFAALAGTGGSAAFAQQAQTQSQNVIVIPEYRATPYQPQTPRVQRASPFQPLVPRPQQASPFEAQQPRPYQAQPHRPLVAERLLREAPQRPQGPQHPPR